MCLADFQSYKLFLAYSIIQGKGFLDQSWSDGQESGFVTEGLRVGIPGKADLAETSNPKFAPWLSLPCAAHCSCALC